MQKAIFDTYFSRSTFPHRFYCMHKLVVREFGKQHLYTGTVALNIKASFHALVYQMEGLAQEILY